MKQKTQGGGTTLKQKIINTLKKRVLSHQDLWERAQARGLSENEFEDLMASVCRDKRIKKTVQRNAVIYLFVPPKVKSPQSHIEWVNENYPRIEYDMPFPEIDMSWMFLKPAEMKAFKAEMKGIPVYMMTKRRR